MKVLGDECVVCNKWKKEEEILYIRLDFRQNPPRLITSPECYAGIRTVCRTCLKGLKMIEARIYAPVDFRIDSSEKNEIGEISPQLRLVEEGEKYAIMCMDEKILEFPDKPTSDPDPECKHEEGPDFEASVAWIDKVCEWSAGVRLKPKQGFLLCDSAREVGWGDEDVLMWYYDRAGRMLEAI